MPLCDIEVTGNTWCLAQFPHHVTALKSMLEVHFPVKIPFYFDTTCSTTEMLHYSSEPCHKSLAYD